MLRPKFTVMLMAIINVACAQNSLDLECAYTTKVMHHLPSLADAKYLSEIKGIDPNSQEETITHLIQYSNGDSAKLEQKYCSMYNFQVHYKIKELNELNFQQSLDNIGKLIGSVAQDYKLKAPLKAVVDMTMNQRSLSTKSAFSYDLPEQAVKSNEYVEHTIGFTPHVGKDQFEAEVEFYFGIGGE